MPEEKENYDSKSNSPVKREDFLSRTVSQREKESNSEEQLEFLKREEIGTMGKDISRLKEIEAQKERERIAALNPEREVEEKIIPPPEKVEEKITPPPEKKEVVKIEKEKPIPLIPKSPKRLSLFKKIIVRLAVIFLLFLVLSFLYWYFGVKRPSEEEIIPLVKKIEITIPPSLISVETTNTFEISKLEEIPDVFNRLMTEKFPEGSFIRVLIKNIEKNQLVSLKEISNVFQIEVPEEIFQRLEPDFTFSIFTQEQGKRIALIARVKEKERLAELLEIWEEKLTEEGVFLSGDKIQTLVPYFETTSWQDVTFRYLTISKQDFGICYTLFNNYFVLTTSFESMRKAIEELKAPKLEEKIGQLLIIGFKGKTVTPQLEEIFKKYKPGGILLLSQNIESKEQLKKLISDLQNLSLRETGLPLLISVDQEGGMISRIGFLEEKTPQSEIKNPEEAYQIGLKRGEELKELGVNLNLAPVLDAMGEKDFYFNRTFQKPVEVSGELAKLLILGQKAKGILTAIKHFPGYVGIPFNPEDKLAEISLPETSQFKKAMEANPEFVMISNVIYKDIDPSLPLAFSPQGVQFLKNNLGSKVIIISDDLSQNSLLRNFSLKEIVTKPIQAGIDVLIFSGYRLPIEQGLDEFFAAFKNGEISEVKINEAVSRIIQFKKGFLE